MAHLAFNILAMPKYVVIDGSNLATSRPSGGSPKSHLRHLIQARESVEQMIVEGDDVLRVIVDASFAYNIADAGERKQFESLKTEGKIEQAPSRSPADSFILGWADENDALVISNDAFRQYYERYPWLTGPGRLVGGMLDIGSGLWTFEERNSRGDTPRPLSELLETAPQPKSEVVPAVGPERELQVSPAKGSGRYTQNLSVQHPTAVLFLLDQSQSMGRGLKAGKSRAQKSASLVDATLYELVLNCRKEEGVEPLIDVAIIGYRKKSPPIITSLLKGTSMEAPFVSVSELQNHVLEVVSDETGRKQPRWVEPIYEHETPMCAAFRAAEVVLTDWISKHPHSFPPIVLNISDGESNDGNPTEPARRITSLRTSDGNVLLFNAFISASDDPTDLLFPSEPGNNPSRVTQTMFEMSSVIPDELMESGRRRGFSIQRNSHAYVQNSEMLEFASFFSFGSSSAFEIGNRRRVDPA
jgi:hypothetical protein